MKCVVILLFAVSAAIGQTGTASIAGTVLDAKTQKPVPAALVIASRAGAPPSTKNTKSGGDGARALRVARAIDTGVLSINANTSVRVSTPFGGFKQSGYGRELGPHALEAYTEVKTIFYATASSPEGEA